MARMVARINKRWRSFQSLVFRRRYVDPRSRTVALEHGVEDGQLPQSIDELRILWSTAGADRSIKPAEDLLERVVVAFAVSARKVGVAASLRLEQRRIFNKDVIRGVAVAHP